MSFQRPKRDDKWGDYPKFGIPIKLTDKVYIVGFKCPMRKEFDPYYLPHERLTCSEVQSHYKKQHKMQLYSVFDLTNTGKYYDRNDWGKKVNYFKYKLSGGTSGKKVPGNDWLSGITTSIFEQVEQAENLDQISVIGVHCTHGVNRTGYVISSFLKIFNS